MRFQRLLCLGLWLAGLACSDTTGPSLDGPPFVTAQLDGVGWIVGPGDRILAYALSNGALLVAGVRRDSLGVDRDALGVVVTAFTTPGSSPLTVDTAEGQGLYSDYAPPGGGEADYATDTSHTGVVRITAVDTARHRIAGTFSFNAVHSTGTGVVQVRAGAFRVDYQP